MADDTNTAEREALGFFLEKRGDVWVVQFKEGGCRPATIPEKALWDAYQAGRASLAASAGSEPVAWPKDAADVREFVGSHFRSLFYANPTGMDPHENDVYELTAHDLLSAFRWWAELHPSPPEGAGWKWVPTVPTNAMLHAAVATQGPDGVTPIWHAYQAMIAAAPPASEAKGA